MIATPTRIRARPSNDGSEPPKPLRERLQDVRTAYGNIPGAFRLVWGADKRSTTIMAALTLISAFLPIAFALRTTALYQRVIVVFGSAAIALVATAWLVERAFDVKLMGF